MRNLVLVVAAVVAAACGGAPEEYVPPGPRTLKASITNKYAVSLFSLSVSVNDTSKVLFTDERIESYESADAEFTATTGDQLAFTLSSVSLGERHDFAPITLSKRLADEHGTLSITYDYDLATANFHIAYGLLP